MPKLRQNCENDAQFISLLRSGDSQAFNDFCESYRPVVIGYVRGKCRRSDIEDIVQEVFIKSFKAKASYDPEKAKLSTWLYRIARSVIIDNYRKKLCRPELKSNSEFDKRAEPLCVINISPVIFSGLDQSEVDLLRLKYVEGVKFHHLAKILNMPEGTVRAKVYRAIAKVRERHSG